MASAIKAYGDDPIRALTLRIMQHERFRSELLAVLGSNAWQAQEIAKLNVALKEARARIAELEGK